MLSIFDTSFASDNLGDHIIVDSIAQVLPDIGADSFFSHVRASSHDGIGRCSRRTIKSTKSIVVTGGNSVPIKWVPWRRNILNIAYKDIFSIHGKVIFFGAGLEGYPRWDRFSAKLFFRIFCKTSGFHSVRDRRSEEFLNSYGVNAIFTGCPTTWKFSGKSFKRPENLECLIVTINPHRSEKMSYELLNAAAKSPMRVVFWPQHLDDILFFKELCNNNRELANVEMIDYSLGAYDKTLKKLSPYNTAYVGLRLHGGMRAMQFGFYAMVASVDNRASDMLGDIDIPLIHSISTFTEIQKHLDRYPILTPKLPVDSIERFTKWLLEIVQEQS